MIPRGRSVVRLPKKTNDQAGNGTIGSARPMASRLYGCSNLPNANPEPRNFYERFMRGENVKALWMNESDFEKGPIK